jgi:hypothetical protein
MKRGKTQMRYTSLAVVALLALCTGPLLASPADRTEAPVRCTVEMYVDLTDLRNQHLTVAQDDARQTGVSIAGSQHIRLYKNCDVNVIVDVTDMIPDPGTLAKGAHPVSVDAVSINNPRTGESQYIPGGHLEQVFRWIYCEEHEGEDVHVDYHWLRNGLCDHAGTYRATVTVTAIGIDP